MEYQEVKEWLDELIRARNRCLSLECLDTNIQAIMHPTMDIHIYKGIEIVADVMGLKLTERKFNDKRMDYFFMYSNIEFFQIGKSDDGSKV